jgi:RNA polymerase sigma-70 factor (ECF subfamily)
MNITEADDATLIGLCIAEKNNERFPRELIRRYGNTVMQTIAWTFRRFSHVVREDVEDVFQEVFTSLYNNECSAIKKFDPIRAQFGTYVSAIARHSAINACRRKRNCEDELTDTIEGNGLEIEKMLENRENMKQIHAVMNSASSKEQLFYSLYFEELVPPEEIAIILNISIDTVYSKKSKIIEKIKNALCVVEKEQG